MIGGLKKTLHRSHKYREVSRRAIYQIMCQNLMLYLVCGHLGDMSTGRQTI